MSNWTRPPRVWILLVLVTVVAAITIISPYTGESILILIAVVAVAYLSLGISTRCPSCRRFFARVNNGRELVDTRDGFKTKMRRTRHYDSEGVSVGYSDTPVQVHVIYNTFLRHYTCKFCHFDWSSEFTTEHEG